MTFDPVSSKEVYCFDNTPECVVCMDAEGIDEEHKSVDSMTNLNRICDCKYPIHPTCLKTWISKNPVCPICNEGIFYEEEVALSPTVPFSLSAYIGRIFQRFICCLSSPRAGR